MEFGICLESQHCEDHVMFDHQKGGNHKPKHIKLRPNSVKIIIFIKNNFTVLQFFFNRLN